jgi:hypothetical protein
MNTEKKCQWAVRMFNNWKQERNMRAVVDKSLDISPIRMELVEMTKDELNYTISRFITEVKKEKEGDPEYPPKSLYEIVVALQLYLYHTEGREYKFLDDPAFSQIRNTLGTCMRQRTAEGLGMNVKKAEIITAAEEEMLWHKGFLGEDTPACTLLYMLGVNFALRARQEHSNLRVRYCMLAE